jgi:hypothetical protein
VGGQLGCDGREALASGFAFSSGRQGIGITPGHATIKIVVDWRKSKRHARENHG